MNALLSRALLPLALVLSLVSPAFAAALTGVITKVADGDTVTIKADGKEERVRLIGIDAPETAQRPWGPKATEFTKKLALGKNARVEMDVTARDKYGRLLGYLYVGDTFVNLELVRQGFAQVYTYPPNVAHTEKFVAAQQEAREQGLNIWHATNGLTESPSDFRKGGSKSKQIRSDVQHLKESKAQPKPEKSVQMVSINSKSRKYHISTCRYYDCKNCVTVPLSEAKAMGGVPCKVCQ